MSDNRTFHTATLLDPPACHRARPPDDYPCGQVLAAGGATYVDFGRIDFVIGSADLYERTTDRWRRVAPMRQPRVGHTATLLSDGTVLVAAGQLSADGELRGSASSEVYDPVHDRWDYTDSTLHVARYFHTATLLDGPGCQGATPKRPEWCGKVLVVGGAVTQLKRESLTSVELYDPQTRTWSETAPLTVPRQNHTATLLPDGRVLVAGGLDGKGAALASAEVYDPATATWAPTGSMGVARSFHTATLLGGPACRVQGRASCGQTLVAGGFISGTAEEYAQFGVTTTTAELYDPDAVVGDLRGAWRPTGSLLHPRQGHAGVSLPNGDVVITGGDHDRSLERYDITDGTWHDGGKLSIRRYDHTATLLDGPACRASTIRHPPGCGELLVAGGSRVGGSDMGPPWAAVSTAARYRVPES